MIRSTVATFRDPKLEAVFQRDGFVVVDFAPPEVVEALLEVYRRLESGIDSGYYPSLMSPDEGYKAAVHGEIRDLAWPLFHQVLRGYEPLLGVFMVKHPGPDTEVPPHQDWIIADESVQPSMNAWAPLTQLSEASGEMKVLPGSHRWLKGLRGSPSFPTQWERDFERVRDELMVTVPIEVGQAMIYDIRVLHGTLPNLSDDTRIVTSLYAVPERSTPLHYHRDDDGVVRGYEVPGNFCTTFMIGDVPQGRPFLEIPDYEVDHLSFDEIAQRYHESSAFACIAATQSI